MRNIVFTDSYDSSRVTNLLNNSKDSFQCLVLKYAEEDRAAAFFKRYRNCRKIDREKAFADLNKDFREKYVKFIAELNDNNHSFLWWGLNLTSKSTFATGLGERIFYFLSIARLAGESSDNLLIISDDICLLKQAKLWARKKKIRVVNAIKRRFKIRKMIKELTPTAIIYAFFRTLLHRCYAKRYNSFKADKDKEYIVVKSLVSSQCFSGEGGFRDVYFGKFIDYLKEKNIPCALFATLFHPYLDNLKRAKTQAHHIDIIPLESYLSLPQLVSCLARSLAKYFLPFQLKGPIEIEGLNVEYLVKREIREDCISTRFFMNIIVYYSTVALTQRINIKKLFYPFENRSWEKMIIFALRKYSSSTFIAGYQHALITPRHIEMFLRKDEMVPLPDKIVTCGEITKNILEREGNFPPDSLKVGCALGQEWKVDLARKTKANKRLINILVILSVSKEYYAKILIFLNKAFSGSGFYNICLRPHPEIPFDDLLKEKALFKFKLADEDTLESAISWSDIVIYHSSSAALYAVSLGVPVIYLKLDNFLDPDPLFELKDLKWTVDEPSELIEILQHINTVANEQFKISQDKAIDYTHRYFYPVTEDNLKEFVEVCA